MWNGPTWPHANSLVMSAMANTLRHYGQSALTRRHLFDLFGSYRAAFMLDCALIAIAIVCSFFFMRALSPARAARQTTSSGSARPA